MHECPGCGQACDCDGEDLWNDAASEDCLHTCDPEDLGDDDFDGDDFCLNPIDGAGPEGEEG